jgi:hypothetical protein
MILWLIAREKYKYTKINYNNARIHSDKKWHLCGQKKVYLVEKKITYVNKRRYYVDKIVFFL